MSESDSTSRRVIQWFKSLARPILEKAESTETVTELDKLAGRLEEMETLADQRFPICLLGQAGVGKSTLINTLIADTQIVVPSGGGTGPLTANALRVVYGERPSFQVQYHSKKQINETRFILEAELQRQQKGDLPPKDLDTGGSEEDLPDLELDSEGQKKTRTEEAIGRACLLVAGAQSTYRELSYLVDALRWVLDQSPKFASQITEQDMARLMQVKEALTYSTNGLTRKFDSAGNAEFAQRLRDHACGFLAPMIMEMCIQWPSPLLENSLELVDLPGIGILSDIYASVTADYLRNRARAVMLVADSRGIRKDDAEMLRSSGFLHRFLYSSDDPAHDPVALIVVAVKIDDVAEENWRNDKAINGAAQKTRAQHFTDVVNQCREDITQRLKAHLDEVWLDQGERTQGKQEVLNRLFANLQVIPVSAPQYRLHCSDDPDDHRPFLPEVEATNIPALREAIQSVVHRCIEDQKSRKEETSTRFFGQVRARLEVLSAQWSESKQNEEEAERFRSELNDFLLPLQREFDTRRGEFRAFLRKTVPSQIESKVQAASESARKEIRRYLGKLRDVHWKTLQAAVRREGTFYGSRYINLPHDFALSFEEPVAEVWSRGLLVQVRGETRQFAEYQAGAVTEVLDWAKRGGLRVSTRLLEALVEAVRQHRQQVNAVGKEAVDELRDKVRSELIRKVEGPIRNKCKRFVQDRQDSGTGVKARILELFDQLANDVVQAASEPAVRLLVEKFREVDKEILAAFGEHSEPLAEAADALIQRQAKKLQLDERKASLNAAAVHSALAAMPSLPNDLNRLAA